MTKRVKLCGFYYNWREIAAGRPWRDAFKRRKARAKYLTAVRGHGLSWHRVPVVLRHQPNSPFNP